MAAKQIVPHVGQAADVYTLHKRPRPMFSSKQPENWAVAACEVIPLARTRSRCCRRKSKEWRRAATVSQPRELPPVDVKNKREFETGNKEQERMYISRTKELGS